LQAYEKLFLNVERFSFSQYCRPLCNKELHFMPCTSKQLPHSTTVSYLEKNR